VNRVGGRDERMADGDHFVAAFTPAASVARWSAVAAGDRTRVGRATRAANSHSNAATLVPCGTQPDKITLPRFDLLVENRFRDGNLSCTVAFATDSLPDHAWSSVD
jgi:hypothetical protein